MDMNVKTLYSENPESDIWRELEQFTYEENIKKYFAKRNVEPDSELINSITGSFLQAHEYFKSANVANLHISPLLLYYGSTNLLYGMTNLLSGEKCIVETHGMRIDPEDSECIADTKLWFNNAEKGGVHVFARALDMNKDLCKYGEWNLKELFGAIAEIAGDFESCYGDSSKIVFLDVFNTPEGKIEKVYYSSESEKKRVNDTLNQVDGFDDSYLNRTEGRSLADNRSYFILRHKINGKDISEMSFSGQPYLRSDYTKNGKGISLSTELNMYISLFVLASLCRYHPEKWGSFVLKDGSGEKLLIEKFIYYAKRMIPNIVLNNLMNTRLTYIPEKYKSTDTIKPIGEHQIKDIVGGEIKKQLTSEDIIKSIRK
ncbi:MAG: hypothetical protein IJF94_04845 [Eubacterium sp.]|nr:hypothetical protein [Eubacterium sp.]